MAEPKLNSPCTGWKRDLPGPNEPIEEAPTLLWFEPTHLDDVFVEISRNVLAVRGLVIWLAGLMGLVTLGGVASLVWGLITDPDGTYGFIGFTFVIFMIFSIAGIGFWITCFAYCSDVSPPRDLPLRFNRARRKVYVHGFHWVWWNPFTRWYVTTASYDWDDLRAEQWKVRGATANGALIVKEGVSIAVVKP
ncbi:MULTISPECIES: DUF6708 domain-containing protein, partial [unclassified Burkholderia]|uniref:DUF6708 domain-containing protein n=1 Tax=unclassified Burkholderia TaxID=2613784 RepID=UPI0009E6E5C8